MSIRQLNYGPVVLLCLTACISPLRACSHIRPTPRNAIVVCPLPALRSGPNSTRKPLNISRSTDLLRVSFGRLLLLFPTGAQRMAILGIDVGGILLTWPSSTSIFFSLPLRRWAASQFGRGAPHWLSCLTKRCAEFF